MTEERDILLIGGGPGGYVAALRAAQLGAGVTLIEKDEVGGVCLNWGCVPTKALVRSAEIFHWTQRAAEFGVKVGGSPEIDWGKVQERKQRVVRQLVDGVHKLLTRAGVQVIKGRGRLVSPTAVEVAVEDGETQRIEAAHIIVATGSSPVQLPIPGLDGPHVLDSTGALALEALPSSILIMGGGVIGCEFASLYRALGVEVVVVELLDRLLPLMEAALGEAMEWVFNAHGIVTHTGSKVTKVESAAAGAVVTVETRNGEKKFEVAKVLSSVGRRPNVSDIGLDEVGVEYDRSGIKVDRGMRTNIPGIYAIGDVVGGVMLAHLASRQGEVAVENALGHDVRLDDRAVPNCIFTLPEAASVGMSEETARQKGYAVKVGQFPLNSNSKAVIQGEPDGFVKVVAEAEYGEVLGVHIFGPHASDLILEPTFGITLENTLAEFNAPIRPHPTLGEAVAEALLAVDGRAPHLLR